MTQRVVVIGAESTGKSTLAGRLAAKLGAPLTGEYVRAYVERLDRPLSTADLDPIARGQIAEEDRHGPTPRVLHDTNLLSTLIYARHYFGVTQAWVEETFAARDYALYLFCQPDIPWGADPGQRESPDARAELHAIFEAELRRRRLPMVRIEGDLDTRLTIALAALS